MKSIKKIFLILCVFIIIFPIILYIGVVIANNCIARTIENDLVKYQLPTDTELVDSVSIAGKIVGNGNGMQHLGAILVISDLSCEELKEHYLSEFDYIEVRKQKTAELDFIDIGNYSFKEFEQNNEDSYYSITCWDSNRAGICGDFITYLLNIDMRGH